MKYLLYVFSFLYVTSLCCFYFSFSKRFRKSRLLRFISQATLRFRLFEISKRFSLTFSFWLADRKSDPLRRYITRTFQYVSLGEGIWKWSFELFQNMIPLGKKRVTGLSRVGTETGGTWHSAGQFYARLLFVHPCLTQIKLRRSFAYREKY